MRGPNGIGKTTVLRCVAGLQPAVAGAVEMPEDSLAYAAHADGLKPTLTVAENLRFWATLFGRSGIDDALTAMDLARLCDRPAGALSAGQKRRLGLARLMVTGRPLWILDEPTVSLDAAAVGLFARAVRDHLAGGGAALMATHIELGLSEAKVLDLNSVSRAARCAGPPRRVQRGLRMSPARGVAPGPLPRSGQRPAFRAVSARVGYHGCGARGGGRFAAAGGAAPAIRRGRACWPC